MLDTAPVLYVNRGHGKVSVACWKGVAGSTRRQRGPGCPGLSADTLLFIKAESMAVERPLCCVSAAPTGMARKRPVLPPNPLPPLLPCEDTAPKPRSGSDLPQSLECLWDGKSLVSHLCRPPEVASWSRSPRDPLQLPAGSAPCRVAAAAPHLGAAAQLQCCALGLSPGKIPPWAEVQQE